MKPDLLRWASALLLGSLLAAQQDGAGSSGSEFDALTRDFAVAKAAASAKLREIMAGDEYQAALEARDRQKLAALTAGARLDAAPFVARAQAAAERKAGSADAVPFLVWLVESSGDQDATAAAVATLIEQHVDDERLLRIVEMPSWAFRTRPPEQGAEQLARIADGSSQDLVRAHALYYRSMMLRRLHRGDAEVAAQADAMVAEAEKLAPGSVLEMRIQGPRFEKERLQIGMTAPDIEGVDLEGVPFKLSDYRGKVVVLDFWGDW